MYTFNPGPSAVYPTVRQYLTDAFDEDWLSAGHRSEKVIGLVRQTVTDLKTKLNVPQDYTVLLTGSATECWEILTQSLTPRRSFTSTTATSARSGSSTPRPCAPRARA